MYQVYKITNFINNKIYIGYTQRSLKLRLRDHFFKAKKGSLSSLHKAIRKYGKQNFNILLIQTFLTKEDMIQGEIFFIKKYNTYNTKYGYNDTSGGDGGNTNGGKKFNKEWKIKLSKSQAGKSRQFSRKFTEAIEKEICQLYLQDQKSTYYLGVKFNCARSTIIAILSRNNIPRRKSKYTGHSNNKNIFCLDEELEICKDYKSGNFSRADLAKKFKCGKTTIRNILLRHNIKL